MDAFVLVREPRGPTRASWALVQVRMDPFVPVLGTNWDQWASLLAHKYWSRFLARTGTEGWALVPVPAMNWDQCDAYIYPLTGEQSTPHCSVFFGRRGESFVVL